MRISGRTLLPSALAAVLSLAIGAVRVQGQVTILPPDPNSPLSQAGTEAEIEAVLRIQDERDPSRILRLVTDFERTYFDSEYRHLVLRLRWQAITELEADPGDIIDAARAALAAQDHFLNYKTGFISNTVAFDLSNQAALYYGSLADAYVALGDGKSALLNGELGLAAVEQAWDLYIQDNEEGAPDFENARGIRDRMELNFLGILVQGYQDGGDPEKVIEYGRRFLEVSPDDLEMLLYVSALMAQRPPPDGSLAEHLATTESYATSALERLREFQDVPNSQKESLLSGAHLTLGLVYAQQGKLDGAVESLARAVTLDATQRQTRTILENVYYARNGSLEGLDEYILDLGARGERGTSIRDEEPRDRAPAVVAGIFQPPPDSPVAKAAKAGDLMGVRELIAAGEDVNAPSGDGSAPLLWAADNFDVEMARTLIAAGADPDTSNNYGITPLRQASRTGEAAMTEVLLDAGADPELTHPEGETPLMGASGSGSLPAVHLLIDRGAAVNATGGLQNQTALMWAAAEGHVEVVDTLLDAGADPDIQARMTSITARKNADFPTGGFTALMWAARNGDEDTVRRLVEGAADLNLKNGDGASAMMIAIYNDRMDMAGTLIDLGAGVNDGSLFTAVEMRRSTTDQFAFDGSRLRPDHPNTLTALDLIKLLLERGADPHQWFAAQFHSTSMPNSDRFNNTPFLRAAFAADVEVLKVFVDYVSDLDKIPVVPAGLWCRDVATGLLALSCNPNPGRTATMLAMTGGRGPALTGGPGYIRDGDVPYREPGSRRSEDALVVLLDAGANPDSRAPDGATLLHQAVQAGSLEMILALANAGVDFNQPNDDGLTPLEVAEDGSAGEARGAGPVTSGEGFRGGRPGAPPDVIVTLLRDLMGLPPAPAPHTVPVEELTGSAPPAGVAQ